MLFHDRIDAGRQLARKLQTLRLSDPLVLALPRGGVPVGFEVARALQCPLDVVVVRKLGAPGQPELAIGALAPDGLAVLNDRLVGLLGVTDEELSHVVRREREEIARRSALYRRNRPPPLIRDRTVIVVDDGVATGATTRAALRHVREQRPAKLILAAPVFAPDAFESLSREADTVVTLAVPEEFQAVGQFYARFDQTSDAEVLALLGRAPALQQGSHAGRH